MYVEIVCTNRLQPKHHIAFVARDWIAVCVMPVSLWHLIAAREHFSGANPIRIQNRNRFVRHGGLLSICMVSESGPGPQAGRVGSPPIRRHKHHVANRRDTGGNHFSAGTPSPRGALPTSVPVRATRSEFDA